MLVDAHCHLFDRQFDADRDEVVERAAAAGVGHLVVIGESRAAAEAALDFAARAGRTGPRPVQGAGESAAHGTGGAPVLPTPAAAEAALDFAARAGRTGPRPVQGAGESAAHGTGGAPVLPTPAAAEAALDFAARAGRTGPRPVQGAGESAAHGTGGAPVLPTPAAAEAAFAFAAAEGGATSPRLSVVAGLHPHDAKDWNSEYEAWLRGLFTHASTRPRAHALGEIGLDYHYDHSPRDIQRQVFEIQLALAQELSLPVVIHAREADDDLLAALRNFPKVRAVLHSFSSGMPLLEGALALGHWASFSGMVTFKNWALDAGIRAVPAGRLMVETDAPYLAPIPHRGQRNEPAYVVKVAERVAIVRGASFEQIAAETTVACREFFGLKT